LSHVLICVPCYKESRRLPRFLEQIAASDSESNSHLKILFLEDGSGQQEQSEFLSILESAKARFKYIELQYKIFPHNRGKGAVLRDGFRVGMSMGCDAIGFIDGDGATPFREMSGMVHELMLQNDTDMIIGSRIKCLGKTVSRSLKRHLSGRIFATILSNLYDIPVYDSQCGAKIFKSRVLSDKVLELCDDNRWLFDTQFLIYLFKAGYTIRERMVDWTDIPGSKVSLLKDSTRMFVGLLQFKKRLAEFGNLK
jgi:glycosyltransferase involved in cell wall biosynthesis